MRLAIRVGGARRRDRIRLGLVRVARPVGRLGPGPARRTPGRQADGEGRAGAERALHRDFAAEHLDELTNDGEAESDV